jgi:membrane associated rhomboid family serine protease
MRENFLVSWSNVFEHRRVWTLVTAAFSHEGLWHLIWNMFYLHWFALELEQIYGRRNFLLLYIYSAVVSSLAHVAWSHAQGFDVPALGASGAVMAVVVVAAIFFPSRLVTIWWVPLPLWLLAALKLLGDFTGLFGMSDGIGHAAHLGGALAGVFFWWLDLRLFASPGQQEFLEEPFLGFRPLWRRLFSRPRPPVRELPHVEPDSAQLDEVLRKIAREGMSSLTPDELAFLNAASERRKRK